ncbi:hypothetical protein P9A16_30140 [Shinella sp. 838]|uniref:hypothetical protein n=1 Tax=unclassified Shinella TaxID=2643062 RepID=UPI00102D4D35|nr:MULTISPECIES: hypothetical protein [unclassified Shinella]MDG4675386.1 hypothetical protein [Shinella sp. 838]TAA55066.1 hypothetical protein EXZ48_25475 [Shinella sp. JR1-6]
MNGRHGALLRFGNAGCETARRCAGMDATASVDGGAKGVPSATGQQKEVACVVEAAPSIVLSDEHHNESPPAYA